MRLAVAALLALLVLATPARAADPAGDLAGSTDSGLDVVGFDFAYDASGTATGRLTFAGAPATDAALYVIVGKPNETGACSELEAVSLNGSRLATGSLPARWEQYVSGSSDVVATGDVQRADTPTSVTFSATAPQLAGQGYTCALALVVTEDGGIVDRADGTPVAAATLAPAGGGTTPATPTAAHRPARLRARLRDVPARVRRGRTVRARLVLRNTGGRRTPRLTVRVKRVKGLAVKSRTLRVRPIRAGASRTVRLRLRLTDRARSRSRLTVVVRGGRLEATARRTVRLRAARR